MIKSFIILMFFLVSGFAVADSQVCTDALGKVATKRLLTVRSSNDFVRYTKMHIKRVAALAHEALVQFPEEFPGLTHHDIDNILAEVHDLAKIDPTLTKNPEFGTYAQRLYQKGWNRAWETMPRREREEFKALIGEVNAVDAKITFLRLAEHEGMIDYKGELTTRGQSYLKIERLADVADRMMTAQEELGRPPYSAAETGRNGHVEEGRHVIDHLLEHHKEITKGLEYKSAVQSPILPKSWTQPAWKTPTGRSVLH